MFQKYDVEARNVDMKRYIPATHDGMDRVDMFLANYLSPIVK